MKNEKLNAQNLNNNLKGKCEINNKIDDTNSIINAVEAFDFIVNNIINSTGKKSGIIDFLNVNDLFNERFLANNNIKLNLANSEGWKVKPKILIQRLASIGLLKLS